MLAKIITPSATIFEGEVSQAKFPGASGGFEVLKDHAPIISTLVKGNVLLRTSEGIKEFQIESGVVEVLNNHITILVEALS